jgi:hypothetical protein
MDLKRAMAATIAGLGKAKAAPEADQVETTKDERANVEAVSAPLGRKGAVAEVNSGWETVPNGLIVSLLLVVLTASTVVIYRTRKVPASKSRALQSDTNHIDAPAQPVPGPALSPDAALVRIEEIR